MTRTPLLLIPGTLNTPAVWRVQAEALSDIAEIRILDVSQRSSTAELADDAVAAMPEGRFALAGFSLGSFVALEVMRLAGARVSALALIGASARPEHPDAHAGREKLMSLAQRDFPRLISTLQQFMLPPSALARPDLVSAIEAMMTEVGPDAFVRQSQAVMSRGDGREVLPTITCPTLIVAGADDKVTPPRFSEEMAAAIPRAELHLLPDTGHMLPMERPSELAALMRGWLERTR